MAKKEYRTVHLDPETFERLSQLAEKYYRRPVDQIRCMVDAEWEKMIDDELDME